MQAQNATWTSSKISSSHVECGYLLQEIRLEVWWGHWEMGWAMSQYNNKWKNIDKYGSHHMGTGSIVYKGFLLVGKFTYIQFTSENSSRYFWNPKLYRATFVVFTFSFTCIGGSNTNLSKCLCIQTLILFIVVIGYPEMLWSRHYKASHVLLMIKNQRYIMTYIFGS